MAREFRTPETITSNPWCPGCGHGIFARLVQEVLTEKGLLDRNICVNGVGCSVLCMKSYPLGNLLTCHHGRAPSVANAAKRLEPDVCFWTYQGEGDAYSIGLAETILAAQNDYPISVFVINNTNYGMTGGQASQTTTPGQVTTTTPFGKDGPALNIIPMIASIDSVAYVARGTTASLSEIIKLKKYISRAIDVQMNEHKYAFVEVLSQCPSNWHMNLQQCQDRILNGLVPNYFPLGEFKGGDAK